MSTFQRYPGATQLLELLPIATIATNTNGAAVDLVGVTGNAALLIAAAAPAGTGTLGVTIKLQESASGTGSWSDIAGASQDLTDAGTAKLVVNTDAAQRYVRAVATLTVDTTSVACSAYLLALPC
jgi:spore maturation protein SpmB